MSDSGIDAINPNPTLLVISRVLHSCNSDAHGPLHFGYIWSQMSRLWQLWNYYVQLFFFFKLTTAKGPTMSSGALSSQIWALYYFHLNNYASGKARSKLNQSRQPRLGLRISKAIAIWLNLSSPLGSTNLKNKSGQPWRRYSFPNIMLAEVVLSSFHIDLMG